jgi:hypothetical protein
MPRWASRLTLTVSDVRVQRLQAISEEDAQAEGVAKLIWDGEGGWYESATGTYRCGFAGIWQHLHGAPLSRRVNLMLSYQMLIWSGREDSNLRPLPPEDATPRLIEGACADIRSCKGCI